MKIYFNIFRKYIFLQPLILRAFNLKKVSKNEKSILYFAYLLPI